MVRPDEVYNLAAQSHIAQSWAEPEHTFQTNALGPVIIFEAIRACGLDRKTKVFQVRSPRRSICAFEIASDHISYRRGPLNFLAMRPGLRRMRQRHSHQRRPTAPRKRVPSGQQGTIGISTGCLSLMGSSLITNLQEGVSPRPASVAAHRNPRKC